jgi:sugar/nucleoside kinase (ribokinase family)
VTVTVVGCITFDTVVAPGRAEKVSLGGSAVYGALGASIATEARMVAAVGSDCPREALSFIEKRGVDLGAVSELEGRTLRWHGEYLGKNLQDRRTIGVDEGVMADLDLGGVDIGSGDILYLATAHPRHQLSAVAGGGHRLVALDTIDGYIGEYRDELRDLLPHVDLLFLNSSEAESLAGRSGLEAAARSLLGFGAKLVCIKRAHLGACLSTAAYSISCPAFARAALVDPTGAGDGFAGAFLGHLDANGSDYTDEAAAGQALVFATAVASAVVEEVGPGGLLRLTPEEIHTRMDAIRQQPGRPAK